jgi:hypothetical protein
MISLLCERCKSDSMESGKSNAVDWVRSIKLNNFFTKVLIFLCLIMRALGMRSPP